jgi:nucleoside-diphosphate-sugar epimerase
MRIFVTGGTGFIGTQLIKRLIADGHEVHALGRSEGSREVVRLLGATPIVGSLADIDLWKESLRGCDAVVHCAAPVEFWGPWERFENEIVTATRHLADAAAAAHVPKFIHISSESVLQDIEPIVNADETRPFPDKPNSHYGTAKMLAEMDLLKTKRAMAIVILRPAFVWGENSTAISEMLERVKSGSFIWADAGQAAFEAVHVQNLVEAITLAVQKGTGTNVYFVTDNEESTFRDFFDHVFDAHGIRRPRVSLPSALIRAAARVTEFLWTLLSIGSKPPITRFEWAFIGMPRKYRVSKITNDLGYRPILSRKDGFQQMAMSKGT